MLSVRQTAPCRVPINSSEAAAMVLRDLLLARGATMVPFNIRAKSLFIWPLMNVTIDETVLALVHEAGLDRELELARNWREGTELLRKLIGEQSG